MLFFDEDDELDDELLCELELGDGATILIVHELLVACPLSNPINCSPSDTSTFTSLTVAVPTLVAVNEYDLLRVPSSDIAEFEKLAFNFEDVHSTPLALHISISLLFPE